MIKVFFLNLLLTLTLIKILIQQYWVKIKLIAPLSSMNINKKPLPTLGRYDLFQKCIRIFRKLRSAVDSLFMLHKHNLTCLKLCKKCFDNLVLEGIKQIDVYHVNYITEILYILALQKNIKIHRIYNIVKLNNFLNFKVLPIDTIQKTAYKGKIIISSYFDIIEKKETLKQFNIDDSQIITLK